MSGIVIWKNQIILKQVDTKVPGFREILEPYVRTSERIDGLLLNFSKQNLQRIYRVYGDIPRESGQHRIDSLKDLNQKFKIMVHKAESIKAGLMDIKIDYKVPPLADYQHKAVVYLMMVERAPLFADCGCGKTFATLVAAEQHIKLGVVQPGKTLVVGKLATLFNGWAKDAEKFTGLKVQLLWEPQGTSRKEKILAKLEEPADVYIINHDGVRVFQNALVAQQFQKVIVDESTILKGFYSTSSRFKGGAFGKALMEVAANAKWRTVLSGTPASNGVIDLFGQFLFLDPDGILLEPSVNDFRASFMERIVYGRKDDPTAPCSWKQSDSASDRIAAIINPLVYRVRIRDVLPDLPACTVIERTVEMSPEQASVYKKMKKTLLVELKDKVIAVDILLAQLGKLRQISGGFIIAPDGEEIPIEGSPKFGLLDDLVEDEIASDEKIVIYAQYRYEIREIAKRYAHYNAVTAFGENSDKEKLNNMDRFLNDPSVRIIVLQPQSMAHGINLVNSHYEIFYSISFSAEENYQARARINRAGQKSATFIYYLMCKGTVDEDIYETLQLKNANQEALIDQGTVNKNLARMIGTGYA